MSASGHDKIYSWLMVAEEVGGEGHKWINQHHSQHPATQNFDMADMQQLRRSWGQAPSSFDQTITRGGESSVASTPTSSSAVRVLARPDHPTLVKAVKSYDTIKLMYPECDILWLTLEVIVKGMCSAESRHYFLSGVLRAYLGNDPTGVSSAKALVSQLDAKCYSEDEFKISHRLVCLVKDLYTLPMERGNANSSKRLQQILPYIDSDFQDLISDALEDIPISRRNTTDFAPVRKSASQPPATALPSSYSLSKNSLHQNVTPTKKYESTGNLPPLVSPTFFSSPAGAVAASSKNAFSARLKDASPGSVLPNALVFGQPFPQQSKVPYGAVCLWQRRVIFQTSPGLSFGQADEAPVINLPASAGWTNIALNESIGPGLDTIGYEIRGTGEDNEVLYPPEVVRLPVNLTAEVLSGIVSTGCFVHCTTYDTNEPLRLELTLKHLTRKGSDVSWNNDDVTLELDSERGDVFSVRSRNGEVLKLIAGGSQRYVVCVLHQVFTALRSAFVGQLFGATFVNKYPHTHGTYEANCENNLRLLTRALSLHADHTIPIDCAVLAALKYEWGANQTALLDKVTQSLDLHTSDAMMVVDATGE